MSLRIRKKSAFTLIELTIVVVLFLVLTGVLARVLLVGLEVWGSENNRANLRQEANLAMERIVRELSQTTSITDANEDGIEFVVDLDDNGVNETVTFDVSGTTLNRTEDAKAVKLAENSQTFALAYYDTTNALMAVPQDVSNQAKRDNIRLINIALTMNNDSETVALRSSVYTRNQGL
ncbi:MAG: type II secretion system GspH family protein [Omnitrophica bacterium]|nr:type II secretion system GspH family protein [Candidatus Omnitrophota bacterium]